MEEVYVSLRCPFEVAQDVLVLGRWRRKEVALWASLLHFGASSLNRDAVKPEKDLLDKPNSNQDAILICHVISEILVVLVSAGETCDHHLGIFLPCSLRELGPRHHHQVVLDTSANCRKVT